MVSFVAQEPDIQPANTAFWGRPIREPKPDVSGGTIGKTIANVFGEGTKFADDYMREGVVAPNVDKQAGALRDQFVDALNTARNSVEPQPLGAPKSLTPDAQAKLPTQIQNVGQNVDMLQKAMESGKLSETDYYGRVDALAKQLRSQYPGYRDEVDRQIYKVTGVHPANSYIRSAITDLNRLVTQHQGTRDKFDSLYERAAFQGLFSDEQMANFQNMHRDHPEKFGAEELAREINRVSFNKAQFEKEKEDAFLKDQNAKDAARHAEGALTNAVGGMVSDAMATEKITVGVYSNRSMDDFLTAYSQGKVQVSDEDMEAQGRQEHVRYNQAYQKAYALAHQPDPDDPQHRSYAELLKGGEKSLDQILKSAFDPWQRRVEAFAGKDPVMGNLHGKLIEAARNDTQYNVRKGDPYIANINDLAEMYHKNLGSNADQILSSSPLWQTQIVPRLQGAFDQAWLAARTQPRLNAGGRPYEFFADILNYAHQDINDPNYLKTLARGIDEFNAKETDPETRKNLGYYFFGPNSGQLVVNATKGSDVVYSQLYTPLTARTMAKYHPDMYSMFEQGAEQNATALFTTNINNLKYVLEHQAPGTAGIEWHGDHFEPTGEGQNFIREDVNKINTMIRGLKPIYDSNPQQDPNKSIEAFMFGRLAQMGFDPTKNVSGMPEQIMRALRAAKGEPTDMQRDVINPKMQE